MENLNILVFLLLGITAFVLFLKGRESLNDFVLYLLTISSVYLISEKLTSNNNDLLEIVIVCFVSLNFISSRFSLIKNLKWNWVIPLLFMPIFCIVSNSPFSYNLYDFSFKNLPIFLLPILGVLAFPIAKVKSELISTFFKITDFNSLTNNLLILFIGIFAFLGAFFASGFGIFLICIGFISYSFFRNNLKSGGVSLLLIALINHFGQIVNLELVDLTLGKTIEGLFIGIFSISILHLMSKSNSRKGLAVFLGLIISLILIFGILMLNTQKTDFGGMDAFIGATLGVSLGIAFLFQFKFSEMIACFMISGALFFGPMIVNEDEQNSTQISIQNKVTNSEEGEEKTNLFELPGISMDSIIGSYYVNEKTVQLTFQLGPKGGVTKGTFKTFSGKIEIKQNIEKSVFEIDLPVEKLTTFNKSRDESVFEKDYFNLKEFPEMHFMAKKLISKDDAYELDGSFEMLGIKKPLKVMLKYIGKFESNGSKVPVLIGKSSIDRTQFGMEPDSKEGNIVDFEFKVELIQK